METGRSVGISPMVFGRYGSWPKPAQAMYSSYLSCLSDFITSFIQRGHEVLLFKSSGIDENAIKDLQKMNEGRWHINIRSKLSTPSIETVGEILEEVKKVDFVIASLLHGVILSHILGKPVLAISYDRKVNTHMEDIG